MRAMKQRGDDDDGKDDNNNEDDRVTLHDVTISHVRGRWQWTGDDMVVDERQLWRTREDNGGGHDW